MKNESPRAHALLLQHSDNMLLLLLLLIPSDVARDELGSMLNSRDIARLLMCCCSGSDNEEALQQQLILSMMRRGSADADAAAAVNYVADAPLNDAELAAFAAAGAPKVTPFTGTFCEPVSGEELARYCDEARCKAIMVRGAQQVTTAVAHGVYVNGRFADRYHGAADDQPDRTIVLWLSRNHRFALRREEFWSSTKNTLNFFRYRWTNVHHPACAV